MSAEISGQELHEEQQRQHISSLLKVGPSDLGTSEKTCKQILYPACPSILGEISSRVLLFPKAITIVYHVV